MTLYYISWYFLNDLNTGLRGEQNFGNMKYKVLKIIFTAA